MNTVVRYTRAQIELAKPEHLFVDAAVYERDVSSLRAELAALQAAPAAVVVLPSENAVMRVVLREMGNSTHVRGTSNWCADIGAAVLKEVAQLNALKAGQGEAVEYQQLSRYGSWDRIEKSVFDLRLHSEAPERFRALYIAPPDIPAGYAMVPIEPTRDMCLAARREQKNYPIAEDRGSPVVVYRAMLAAVQAAQ